MMPTLEPRDFTPVAMYRPNSNLSFMTKIDFIMVERRNLNDSQLQRQTIILNVTLALSSELRKDS
jgi:hypothetical protein